MRRAAARRRRESAWRASFRVSAGLLPIANDPQVPAVPLQRPLQHSHARIEPCVGFSPRGRIDPLHVNDVIDAQLVFGGLAGRGQHDAERVVVRQESGEEPAAGQADLFRGHCFVVAVEQGSAGDLPQIHSHFVGGAW